MRVAVLTSSRADFGIYIPLLNLLRREKNVDYEIIAFGSHLSVFHGYTVLEIINKGFNVNYQIDTQLSGDSPDAINSSISITINKFSSFWSLKANYYDFVLCLGDRYEMMAAVLSGIGHRIRFVHIHAGESTLGSHDDVYRNTISLCSSILLTSTETYAHRAKDLCKSNNVYCVGALSLDGIESLRIGTIKTFKDLFGIDLEIPTILFTYHPDLELEADFEKGTEDLINVIKFFSDRYQFIISTPNADAGGARFYKHLTEALSARNCFFISNMGKENYFTAMKFSKLLVGNTSSGIIEAASFRKYTVNIGKRQEGRAVSGNVLNASLNYEIICDKVEKALALGEYLGDNIYYKSGVSEQILQILKDANGK